MHVFKLNWLVIDDRCPDYRISLMMSLVQETGCVRVMARPQAMNDQSIVRFASVDDVGARSPMEEP